MTVAGEPLRSAPLVQRARNLILRPGAEWERIAGEPSTVGELFRGYALPLAAIGPVCTAIGATVFGYGLFGVVYRPPLVSVIVQAIIAYVLALAMVFVLGVVIEALAPTFDAPKDRVRAMKVAVYAGTAAWLVGVLGLVPILSPLEILGLYSLYLLYVGIGRVMQPPQEKALAYTGLVIVIAIGLAILLAAVMTPLRMLGAAGPFTPGTFSQGTGRPPGALSGTLSVGNATVDLGKLQGAAAQLEARAKGQPVPAADGGVAPEALKALLPPSVAGYTRGDVSTGSAGAAGFGVANAEAQYRRGDATITLEVTDLSAAGALSGLAGALGVKGSRETSTSYERLGQVDGRMTMESYDHASGQGKYSVMAGERIMIAAAGQGASIDDLKAAVAAVGPARAEALVRQQR